MQKVGLTALLGILAFALVFALLPSGNVAQAQTGVTLQGVQLALYPARDPDAVWRFSARDVRSDPTTGTTDLSGLSGGERRLRERGADGGFTGRETLDATITAPRLSIDAQDDLTTSGAELTLVRECATLSLSSTPEQPVRIEQGQGFSAPRAELDAPAMRGEALDLRMDFQFNVLSAASNSTFGWDPEATETCRGGVRVPISD